MATSALGFAGEDRELVEGEWVDTITGLDGVRAEIMMIRTPHGSGTLELVKYHRSADNGGTHPVPANRLGFRHIALEVTNLNAIVAGLGDNGFNLVGGVRDYEETYRLGYVRGPEGLIIELVERLATLGAS